MTITTLAGETRSDVLAVEEPLEIRLIHGSFRNRQRTRLTVTLRTPGHDEDLAAGLLFAEGVIADMDDVIEMNVEDNIVRIELKPNVDIDLNRIQRTFAATSSCGLCGKSMIEQIETHVESISSNLMMMKAEVIAKLPDILKLSQPSFQLTGGVHAAGLFDRHGELLMIREDVGRHNAVDKVLGHALRNQQSCEDRILVVSGRAGYELVQKAARCRVPVMVAVGAPTTLAVELAGRLGVTLVGFVRDGRGNVYSHHQRIKSYPTQRR